MSPLGFKARVGSALFAIFVEANVMYIPQESIDLLEVIRTPVSGPSSIDISEVKATKHRHLHSRNLHTYTLPAIELLL